MIKTRKLVVSTFAGVMLLVAGHAIAKQPAGLPDCAPDCVRQNPVIVSAPEIDVSFGGSAIALLVTVMLIAAERRRRT